MQDLDRHPALERLVERAVDRRHAAGADPVLDPVAAVQPCADHLPCVLCASPMPVRVQLQHRSGMPLVLGGRTRVRKLHGGVRRRDRLTFVMGGLAREFDAARRAATGQGVARRRDRPGMPAGSALWPEGAAEATYPACMAVKAAQPSRARVPRTATCGGCGRDHVRAAQARRGEALVEEARAAGWTSSGSGSTLRRTRSRRRSAPTSRSDRDVPEEARDAGEVQCSRVPARSVCRCRRSGSTGEGGELERRVRLTAGAGRGGAAGGCGARRRRAGPGVRAALRRFGRVTTPRWRRCASYRARARSRAVAGSRRSGRRPVLPVLAGQLWRSRRCSRRSEPRRSPSPQRSPTTDAAADRPAASVTSPITRAPGWRSARSPPPASAWPPSPPAEPGAHVEHLPHLRVGGAAAALDQAEDRLRSSGASMRYPTSASRRSRFSSPSPVMCARPCTCTSDRAARARRARRSRSAPAARRRPCGRRAPAAVSSEVAQRPARERVAVGVHAARGHADDGRRARSARR